MEMKKIIAFIKQKSTNQQLLKEERQASRYILKQYESYTNFLALTEQVQARKSANEILRGKKIKELTDEGQKNLEPFFPSLYNQGIVSEKLKELRYLARAFYFFLAGKTPHEVMIIMKGKNWNQLHEISVRLAWMIRQKDLILRGNQFNHPFLCYVGGQANRRNMDREFYSIMTFISLFSKRRKAKYLFDSIPSASIPSIPRPDFIIKDQSGNRLGIEVTEANSNSGSHFEDETREKLQKKFRNLFKRKTFTILLHSNPNWNLISAELEQVVKWVRSESKKAEKALMINAVYSTSNPRYNISLRFDRGTGAYSFFDSGGTIIGIQPEVNLGKGIKDRIEAKLKKKKSDIRPCYLVVFMREGVPFMKTKVVKTYASKGLGKRFLSHFDQIWAVKEGRLIKIA